MYIEGMVGVKPEITKITFTHKGKMSVHLKDGRIIAVPLNYFPSIKKLTSDQRAKWGIIDGVGFTFDDCDEIFHIEQVLGKEKDYKYSFV